MKKWLLILILILGLFSLLSAKLIILELNDETIDLLYKSAPLHDIGKVGIPDKILLKPGKLDEQEFSIMMTHAQLGGDALELAEADLGTTSFLKYAREIATTHHEKCQTVDMMHNSTFVFIK